MEKKNTKRSISRYLYFIVTSIAIIFSIALPSLKVSAEEAEDWELFYFGDDDENLKVYYSASLGKLKAEIPSNIAVKEWIGQGSSGQSVPSMFSGLSYHSISIGKEVTNLDGRVMKGVTVLDELAVIRPVQGNDVFFFVTVLRSQKPVYYVAVVSKQYQP